MTANFHCISISQGLPLLIVTCVDTTVKGLVFSWGCLWKECMLAWQWIREQNQNSYLQTILCFPSHPPYNFKKLSLKHKHTTCNSRVTEEIYFLSVSLTAVFFQVLFPACLPQNPPGPLWREWVWGSFGTTWWHWGILMIEKPVQRVFTVNFRKMYKFYWSSACRPLIYNYSGYP